jgi:hypothetical protein
MGAPSVTLSYGARREVLAQVASRYQQATGAQKMLLLDRVVEVTGYARKYAIQLLNHVPERASTSREKCFHDKRGEKTAMSKSD